MPDYSPDGKIINRAAIRNPQSPYNPPFQTGGDSAIKQTGTDVVY
jgi:hypothetical protein